MTEHHSPEHTPAADSRDGNPNGGNPNGGNTEDSSASGFDGSKRYVPLLETLSIRHVETADGRAVFALTVEEKHCRTMGLLHGGVTATLLDTCMGYAAVSVAPPDHYVVTVQLNVNFTRPVKLGDTLRAEGTIEHRGGTTAVGRGRLLDAAGKLAAAGTATFMFLPRPAEVAEADA